MIKKKVYIIFLINKKLEIIVITNSSSAQYTQKKVL